MRIDPNDLGIALKFDRDGCFWKAYIAVGGSVDQDPLEIGSISMRAVDEDPDLRASFMELMLECASTVLQSAAGFTVKGFTVREKESN